jgi:hypothetical protein
MRVGRRQLLGLGCAAAAALPLLRRAAPAGAQGRDDREPLGRLLGLEQEAGLLYGTLQAGRRLPARLFRAHSREHARGLELALRNRGGRAPAPRARAGRASAEQALRLETRAVGAYWRAIGELGDEALLPTLAAIMANHGQHALVLREELGRDPLPAAFPGEELR